MPSHLFDGVAKNDGQEVYWISFTRNPIAIRFGAYPYPIAIGLRAASERLISRLRVSYPIVGLYPIANDNPVVGRLPPNTRSRALRACERRVSGGISVSVSDCRVSYPIVGLYPIARGNPLMAVSPGNPLAHGPATGTVRRRCVFVFGCCGCSAGCAAVHTAGQLWRVDSCAVRGLRGRVVNVADFREVCLFVVLL